MCACRQGRAKIRFRIEERSHAAAEPRYLKITVAQATKYKIVCRNVDMLLVEMRGSRQIELLIDALNHKGGKFSTFFMRIPIRSSDLIDYSNIPKMARLFQL
jgi:hypothetical protein